MTSIQTTNRPALKLAHERESDRWSHTLYIIEDEIEIKLASTIEGTPEDDWPPSPPLQEVTPQGDSIILGVGMAGKSHWSASFSIESDDSLLCDLACLSKNPPEKPITADIINSEMEAPWIGIVYELPPGFDAVTRANDHVVLVTPSGHEVCFQPAGENPKLTHVGIGNADGRTRILASAAGHSESPVIPTRWAWRISSG